MHFSAKSIFLNLYNIMIIYFYLYCITRRHSLNRCLPDVIFQIKPASLNNEFKAGIKARLALVHALHNSHWSSMIWRNIGCPHLSFMFIDDQLVSLIINHLLFGGMGELEEDLFSSYSMNNANCVSHKILQLMTEFTCLINENLILFPIHDMECKALFLLEVSMEGQIFLTYSSSSSMMNVFYWSWITRHRRSSQLAFLYKFHTCSLNGVVISEMSLVFLITSLKKVSLMYNLPCQKTISHEFYHCGFQVPGILKIKSKIKIKNREFLKPPSWCFLNLFPGDGGGAQKEAAQVRLNELSKLLNPCIPHDSLSSDIALNLSIQTLLSLNIQHFDFSQASSRSPLKLIEETVCSLLGVLCGGYFCLFCLFFVYNNPSPFKSSQSIRYFHFLCVFFVLFVCLVSLKSIFDFFLKSLRWCQLATLQRQAAISVTRNN
ncbi:hypothetical protein VP01_2036g1 [Puccinia sorghi]|uniref:Uncharacterized protein n=1 Tax=Puccinia sorghi TaxID=27349 RepID=A0A0L6VCV1_9BASI|nr:hypothetical protein VP01_2036g1 [Puccinia sorghi]